MQYMQNRRRHLKATGRWKPRYVDAAPVRAHVQALLAAGMSQPALARRLNLPETAFKYLLRGDTGRPPGRVVSRETAEAVLGYWPVLKDFPDTASIDPTGTRRRVQALETLGWSKPRMAAELGMMEENFKACLRRRTVSARFARKVAALYDQLWTVRPEDRGVQQWVADRVRRRAAANGFHGPLAWDDDTIDDPAATPAADALEPIESDGENLANRWLMGESVILGPKDRKEVLAHLYEWTNLTKAEIAEKLGMTPEAAERQWHRIKEKAQAEGRRVWRRVYVPRERTMNQDEMGEAA
jgi:hypothetical protein